MEIDIERWLDMPYYEGHYQVSDRGRIRSLDRHVPHSRAGSQFVRGRILRVGLDSHGYPRLNLKLDGSTKSWAVHRAVLLAFQPRDDWEQMHVNHKDGNPRNNRIENIEWCTASENRLHSYRVLKTPNPATGKFGALHHNSVAVVGRCIATGEGRRFAAMSEARRAGFRDVSACIRGEQKSSGGWTWRLESRPASPMDYSPTRLAGSSNPQAKPVERIGPDGAIKRYEYARAAVADGFNPIGISHVLRGHQRTHGGYEWRYA